MVKKRIIILGAGLTGLSAAWHLKKSGIDCLLFEKESEIGGLCRSKTINGFTFDFSGHLLHFKNAYAFNLVNSLLSDKLRSHKRSAWVYSFSRYTPYPFQGNLYGLPVQIINECLSGFIEAQRNKSSKNKKEEAFSSWIISNFGKGIAKYFLFPYNTKFWTLHPRNLTCEWLDGFIPRPSLQQVIAGAEKKNRTQFGYNTTFWYPEKGGIIQLPLALAEPVKKRIFTDSIVTEIDLGKKEVVLGPQGSRERFDYLISTIPLPEILYLIPGLPLAVSSALKKLRWNSIFNLNLGVERAERSKRHWIYFPEKDITFFRAGFFNNFSKSLQPLGKSSFYVEAAYSRNRLIEKSKMPELIKNDLEKVGLLGKGDTVCCQQINDIKYAYPIYDHYYKSARVAVINYLLSNSVYPCGRFGSWRYLSMEDSILQGKEVSERLS